MASCLLLKTTSRGQFWPMVLVGGPGGSAASRPPPDLTRPSNALGLDKTPQQQFDRTSKVRWYPFNMYHAVSGVPTECSRCGPLTTRAHVAEYLNNLVFWGHSLLTPL